MPPIVPSPPSTAVPDTVTAAPAAEEFPFTNRLPAVTAVVPE